MSNRQITRRPSSALTPEERRALITRYGTGIVLGARALHVSVDTYNCLIDPCGRVSINTLERIRAQLAEGPFDPDTGETR